VRFGNLARRLSTGVPPVMVLMLGISKLADWASTDNNVTSSSRRLCLQFNRRPNWERKSTSIREYDVGHHSHMKSRLVPG
jgi:hypothetical protein